MAKRKAGKPKFRKPKFRKSKFRKSKSRLKATKSSAARRAGASRRAEATPRAIEAALAGVAHDIRTPLTGILALAELLASSNLPPRERQWANAIKSGAEHLATLTTLIVDAARAEATGLTLHRDPFSPRRLAELVGEALAARAETKGIKADVAIARDLPAAASGDMMRLRAALENLADNAVKFTGQGGVKYSAISEPIDARHVRLVFTFADSGIGLSAQEIDQLFKPFAQASEEVARRYGGAGLGLVFVKRIAEKMGGTLAVTSEPGRGSTFRLSVPAMLVDAQASAAREATTAPARQLAVLCAEDNPYGRVVMNTILNELGHHVDFADTGEAAVQAAARGGYDAVLMDLMLPGVDGLEATRRIRAIPGKLGRVPIIGISGRSEVGKEEDARAAGMDFYFVKPVSPAKLAQTLADLDR